MNSTLTIKVGGTNYNVDLTSSIPIPINRSIADLTDLSKKKSTISLNIQLPATSGNNAIFQQLWHFNTDTGLFDLNKTYRCTLQNESVQPFDSLNLMLNSISYQGGDNQYNAMFYNVQIIDDTALFFSKLDGQKLEDLASIMPTYSHIFEGANVDGSFNNTYSDGYVYPMTLTSGNNTALRDWKPCHYVRNLFDYLHAYNGKSYEIKGLDIAEFNKLIIFGASNGKEKSGEDYKVLATNTKDFTGVNTVGLFTTKEFLFDTFTEILDLNNDFTPATGSYNTPYQVGVGESVRVRVSFDFDLKMNPISGLTYLVDQNGLNGKFQLWSFLRVYKNGTLCALYPIDDAITTPSAPYNFSTLTTIGNQQGNIEVAISNLNAGDDLTFKLYVKVQMTTSLKFRSVNTWTGGADYKVNLEVVTNQSNWEILPPNHAITYGETVNMNDWLPVNYKSNDFVRDLAKMFNFLIYEENNKVTYQTFDDYYSNSLTIDLNDKIDLNKGYERQFLSQQNPRKEVLTYKEDSDFFNEYYTKKTAEIFGQANYYYDNEISREVEENQLTLSPTPTTLNFQNIEVPAVATNEKINRRILFHEGTQTSVTFNINQGSVYSCTNAPICLNSNQNIDLNFGTPITTFSPTTPTNNNLYNLFYRNYFFNKEKSEMLTAWFGLNSIDLEQLKLYAKIMLFGKSWIINKIEADGTFQQLTKVELVSYQLNKTRGLNITPITEVDPTPPFPPIFELLNQQYNVNLGNGIVRGFGNVAQGYEQGYRGGQFVTAGTASIEPLTIINTNGDMPLTFNAHLFVGCTSCKLPNIANYPVGTEIKISNKTGVNVTLSPYGSNRIGFALSYVLATNRVLGLVSDGTQFWHTNIY